MLKIILSRFKKTKESKEIERKRKICKPCKFNSLNAEDIPFKKRALKYISDFYSKITFNADKDVLGGCLACGCSVYYKTEDEEETCPKNKW